VYREAFPLLLNHTAELVSNEAEDILGVCDGYSSRRGQLVGLPQGLLDLCGVSVGVKVAGHHEVAAFGHF